MSRSTVSRPYEGPFCPSCDKRLTGTQVIEVGEINLETGTAPVKLLGIRIDHDCIPKMPRSGGALTVRAPGLTDPYERDGG